MTVQPSQSLFNTLVSSIAEIYPQFNYKQKVSASEGDQTRTDTSFTQGEDKVEFSSWIQKAGEAFENNEKPGGTDRLSEEEKQEVESLKVRDREVHAHEQAHMAAGGNLVTGGPNYQYETGPDGHRYAVGGEVSIDTNEVNGDPQATMVKAQRIRQAALAPADPSAQDRAVAAEAATMAFKAQIELSKETRQGRKKTQTQSANIDLFA